MEIKEKIREDELEGLVKGWSDPEEELGGDINVVADDAIEREAVVKSYEIVGGDNFNLIPVETTARSSKESGLVVVILNIQNARVSVCLSVCPSPPTPGARAFKLELQVRPPR